MSLTPAQLRAEAETLLADGLEVLTILEALPLPANVKSYVAKADAFVKAVDSFLTA